jgi:hypothetical protein
MTDAKDDWNDNDTFHADWMNLVASKANAAATAVAGNLGLDNFDAAEIVTAGEGISSNNNDTTIPTSAAVKAYADSVGGGGGGGGGTPAAGSVTTPSFAASTLVTATEGITSNNNDTTVPTSAAVKAYADAVGGGGGGGGGVVDSVVEGDNVEVDSTDPTNPIVSVPKIATRVASTTSSATPAINLATTDLFIITAQAVPITSMSTSLTGLGTATDGQQIMGRITDNGTAQSIAWGSSWRGDLPMTTVPGQDLYFGGVYNDARSTIDVIAMWYL